VGAIDADGAIVTGTGPKSSRSTSNDGKLSIEVEVSSRANVSAGEDDSHMTGIVLRKPVEEVVDDGSAVGGFSSNEVTKESFRRLDVLFILFISDDRGINTHY
jgi:hypothetical protein